MPQTEGNRSLYEVLGVPRSASHEEIEAACWDLWGKYQSKSATVLAKQINHHIEQIHDTLLNSQARAVYDKSLVEKERERLLDPTRRGSLARWGLGNSYSRNCLYIVGVISAFFFHWMIETLSPETWDDMAMIGWLLLFFSGAISCFTWTLTHIIFPKNPGKNAGVLQHPNT
jgi:hypothetical protein